MGAGRSRPTIGLALGAGGARGWCHIGVLKELEEMDLRPDVIAGASMGALVGAVYAHGALCELERWARALTARSIMALVDVRLSSGGLVEGAEVFRELGDLFGDGRIEALGTPLILVATDMETGREVWLREGDLASAVRASVALPGVFCPTEVDGRWMLDGGLTNPVPVTACHLLGADVVIAVNPNARSDSVFWNPARTRLSGLFPNWRDRLPGPVADFLLPNNDTDARPGYVDTLSAAIDIMTNGIMRSKLAGDPPHVLLEAELTDMSILEFHRAGDAIEEGRRIVRDAADRIERIVRR